MDRKAQNILEKVGRLYERYGIKSITMDDVAGHLNISKKTIYEHFADKEELVGSVLMMDHEKKSVILDSIAKRRLNAIDELFEVYSMINNFFKAYNHSMEYDVRKYYPDLHSRIREIKRKRMFEVSYNNMIKGKKEGVYRTDLNARILARLHVYWIETLMDNDMFTLGELTSQKMFHEIFIYHIHGILSHEGRIYFGDNQNKFKVTVK